MKSSTVASRRRERSTPKSLRERQPESASVVSRSVLLGIVPVLIPAPPILLSFSTSATRFPKIAAVLAPEIPAGPLPMTMRSKEWLGMGFQPVGIKTSRSRFQHLTNSGDFDGYLCQSAH